MSGALLRPAWPVRLTIVVALLGSVPQTARAQEPQRHEQSEAANGDAASALPGTTEAASSGEVATLGGVEHDESSDTPNQGESSEAPLEQVVVSGEQPGPGLWKVTNGSRTLWIVSTLSPTPKELKWRSRQVETIVASAGLVFADFEVKPNIGIFRGLRYLPAVLRARFNPDKATLKDLISPEQYARWLPLRKQYFKDDDDIEKVRPMLIAFALYGKAMDKAGLMDSSPVGKVMSATAKKNRVKWKITEIDIEIKKPKELIKAFVETTPRENDVGCFLEALDNLETELETMKQRAAAWAVGDIEAFRKLPRPAVQRMCMKAVTSAPAVDRLLGSVIDRFNAAWRAEADVALATYETSIAVIDLDSLVREDGVISHLRGKGYTVEEPK
jgi:uncharacterized protein YbaP (TraB family)